MTRFTDATGTSPEGGGVTPIRTAPWRRAPGKFAASAVWLLAALLMLVSVQASVFKARLMPRMAEANQRLSDLLAEETQGQLYADLDAALQSLYPKSGAVDVDAADLAHLRSELLQNFSGAPLEALEALRAQLSEMESSFGNSVAEIDRLWHELGRLEDLYANPYAEVLAQVEEPSWYLRPAAGLVIGSSGYEHTLKFNLATYLAQVGRTGTARVLLAGLHATVDDTDMVGLVNFSQGRLYFEQFRMRSDADSYGRSVHYTRQSVQADADSSLARRFLDFLMSLRQVPPATTQGPGDETRAAEGEGAAQTKKILKF